MNLAKIPRWKKVEVTQSLFGLGMLILLMTTSLYYWDNSQTTTSSEEKTGKLKIASEAPPASTTTFIPIRIWAEDGDGKIDKTRNDTIKLNIQSKILQLNQDQVSLVEGEARIEVYAVHKGQENVLITAIWVSGESYLEPASMQIVYPPVYGFPG